MAAGGSAGPNRWGCPRRRGTLVQSRRRGGRRPTPAPAARLRRDRVTVLAVLAAFIVGVLVGPGVALWSGAPPSWPANGLRQSSTGSVSAGSPAKAPASSSAVTLP